MIRTTLFCLLICTAVQSYGAPRASLVTVRTDGTIVPTGAVVRITELSQMAAQALAQSEAAAAAAQASLSLSNELDRLEGLIASQQQHAIFRGFVTSFSSVVDPVTNATSQILSISTAASGTNTIANLAVWFSTAPTNSPDVETRTMLSTGSWAFASTVSNSWPSTIEVVGTGGVWEAYALSVAVPASYQSCFFRVNGDVQYWSGDDTLLPIYGGLRVNGLTGLTTNIMDGATTNSFVGGVLVQ